MNFPTSTPAAAGVLQTFPSGGAIPVTRKPALNNERGMAFGTNEGHIVSASFSGLGERYCSFVHGEEIRIVVEATFCQAVGKPSVTLTIQDQRLLVVSGQHFRLCSGPAHDGWQSARLAVRFSANLAPGRYHVTLKLLNGDSDETSQLIEKQVALLAFDMLPGATNFLGTVNLGLQVFTEEVTDAAGLEERS